MNVEVRALERGFDAEFLGMPVHALDIPSAGDQEELAVAIAAALADLDPAPRRIVSARIPADHDAAGAALRQADFRLVEELITLRAALDSRPPTPVDPRVRLARPDDVEAAATVARRSFIHDRYHADPFIDNASVDDFKAQWVRNDLQGRADACFVATADDSGEVVGFNLCLGGDSDAVIDLIAVDPDSQGVGLGRALVEAGLDHYADTRAGVCVGTQSTNLTSLRLYRSCGFVELRRQHTYHLVVSP